MANDAKEQTSGRVLLRNSRGTGLLALLLVISSGIVVIVTYAGFTLMRERTGSRDDMARYAALSAADSCVELVKGDLLAHKGKNTLDALFTGRRGYEVEYGKEHFAGTAGNMVSCRATVRAAGGTFRVRAEGRAGAVAEKPEISLLFRHAGGTFHYRTLDMRDPQRSKNRNKVAVVDVVMDLNNDPARTTIVDTYTQ